MKLTLLGLALLSTMPDVREATLDNGLRLLVLEDHSQPRVACKILTRFGAVVEEPGRFGSAHFLEHLLFKGTTTIGTHDWERERPLLAPRCTSSKAVTTGAGATPSASVT